MVANTSEVMAEYLAQAGVQFVFGYPGDSNIELMEAARRRDVDIVLARREGTAGAMAEGLAMATGGLGVCVSTLGPGSSALVNPVACANLDRVPVLAISGQIESSREPYFTHQVLDHNRLFSPITKWAGRVEDTAVGTVMRRALRLATAERPGVVHLTVNADVARREATDSEVVIPPLEMSLAAPQIFAGTRGADPLAALRRARRPIVLAGIAALRLGAGPAITRLAERAGMPVVVSPMAKGVVPEDDPWFAGVADMACNQVVGELLAGADLVLAVGFDAVELIKPWTLRAPVIHVDAVPNTDQIYSAEVELVGAIGPIVDWLAEQYQGEPRWEAAEVEAHRSRLRTAYYEGRVSGALNPTDVVDVLRAASPRDALVTTDVGSHKLLVGQGWTTYEPRTSLMTNGLSSMGFSLPAAIGAKLAVPDRPVVCTIGDGGFAMVQSELRLASSLGLGIVVVVFCDGSLNRIELKQMRLGYPSTATRIEHSDLVGLAEAMDCHGVRVDSSAGLEKVLADTDVARLDRPLVVEAVVDPAQYDSQY
jgi:acetolactate synthase I/II/III large subunit